MEGQIRPMPQSDCRAASRLICAAFRRAAEEAGLEPEEILHYEQGRGSAQSLRAQWATDRFIAAYADADLIGVASTCGTELTKLYVAPAHQRRGVGAQLFAAAQQHIASEGHGALVAGVLFDSAIPFYQRMGLTPLGRKFDLCGPGPGHNVLIMKKPLT